MLSRQASRRMAHRLAGRRPHGLATGGGARQPIDADTSVNDFTFAPKSATGHRNYAEFGAGGSLESKYVRRILVAWPGSSRRPRQHPIHRLTPALERRPMPVVVEQRLGFRHQRLQRQSRPRALRGEKPAH